MATVPELQCKSPATRDGEPRRVDVLSPGTVLGLVDVMYGVPRTNRAESLGGGAGCVTPAPVAPRRLGDG